MLIIVGARWELRVIANPHVHEIWAASAVNLALIGAARLMADAIANS